MIDKYAAYVVPAMYAAIGIGVAYGGYKAVEILNARENDHSAAEAEYAQNYANYCANFEAECEEEEKRKYDTNPSDGSVSEDTVLEKRSSCPDPDPRAKGNPHTIIEKPGAGGQYTTHNGDGTFKQYRGSGQPHGGTPRPNVKENQNNPSPSGPRPGNSKVREARPDEIPVRK